MLRVMQTRPGTPHDNCRAACYAFIFELALDDLPDSRWPEATPWQGRARTRPSPPVEMPRGLFHVERPAARQRALEKSRE